MRAAVQLAVLLSASAFAACGGHRLQGQAAGVPGAGHAEAALPSPSPSPAPSPSAQGFTDLFEREVRPMLAQRCSPCHAPGGKMYARLPFDDPPTVRSHKDAILGRLRTAEDRLALERWFQQEAPRP